MLANFLIGLREGLEAALVVGILIAYVVRTGRRDLLPAVWVGAGVAVAVSLGFGAALTFGPQGLTDDAQEAISGVLAVAAVGLVTWMIFWMARTARFLKTNLQHGLDTAIAAGTKAVVLLAALAVGREGLETALFLWASAKAASTSSSPLVGSTLGLASAVALGWLVYRGAVRLDLRVFFAWTGLFLVVVAAGVLSYGVHDLQEAGILPGAEALAFNVSAAIPPASWYATLLKGVFNFSPVTTWLQLVAWAAYLVPTGYVFIRTTWGAPAVAPQPAPLPVGMSV